MFYPALTKVSAGFIVKLALPTSLHIYKANLAIRYFVFIKEQKQTALFFWRELFVFLPSNPSTMLRVNLKLFTCLALSFQAIRFLICYVLSCF